MPSKRWYFDVREEEIFLIHGGQHVVRNGKPVGRIRSLANGADEQRARSFKDQAIMVKCLCDRILLSRAYFDWNKTEFSSRFKNASNAQEFIDIWRDITEVSENGYPIPKDSTLASVHVLAAPDDRISSQERNSSQINEQCTESSVEPPIKKPCILTERSPIDISIERKRIGFEKIPIANTTEPPPCRLLRRTDPRFVESLVNKMIADPLGPGVPPIAVVCKSVDDKDKFKEHLKDIYKYEVHGGNHSRAARLAVLEKNPGDENYGFVVADVYVGLTDAECLRLAARHNINGHFHHDMTHRDYLEACRARLFVLAEMNSSCDETPAPSLAWKKSCNDCILPPDMSRTARENTFCQASFSKDVWKLAVTAMNMYEEGILKDQRLSQKNLLSTPDFKQQNFLPLHHLDKDFQLDVLQKLVDRIISLSEMKKLCFNHRALTNIKKYFVRLTNSHSWDVAKEHYPSFGNDARLSQFIPLNFSKDIPDVFRHYCQAALNSVTTPTTDCYTVVKNGSTGYVLQADSLTVTAANIKEAVSSYQGANLILAHIPQDWTQEDMENLSYNTRQLNSLNTSLTLFNFAVICKTDQVLLVETAMKKCYDHVSKLYAYDEATPLEPGVGITSCVIAVVVGHWAQNGQLSLQHFTVRARNIIRYEHDSSYTPPPSSTNTHTHIDLMKAVIGLFSYEEHWVLDLLSSTGSGIVAALSMKRNCVAVEQLITRSENIKQRLLCTAGKRASSLSSPEIPVQN